MSAPRYVQVVRAVALLAATHVAGCPLATARCNCQDASRERASMEIYYYGPCTPQDLDAGCAPFPVGVGGALIPPELA